MSSEEKDFVQLVTQHQGLIHKVALMYETDPEARNDLFQEIVLQLWKSFPSFRGEAKITTWMYRIALNTAISGLRRKNKKPPTEDIHDRHLNISENQEADQHE